MDRPLAAWKGTGSTSGVIVVPHLNWRGLFGKGTDQNGNASTAEIEWPGFQTTASHSRAPTQMPTKTWFGGVLEGQRDAGGQMYMRNRYYDPATGQFTQTDPIGIAGGLNTYGFANGDPVTYSDPYGLCGLAGAAASVVEGAAVSIATGSRYSVRAAAGDAATGAVCLGVLRRLGRFARFAVRQTSEARAVTRTASQRAGDIHNALPTGTRGRVTTAVAETEEGVRVVSSSEGRLRPAQRAALQPGEVHGVGQRGTHAEVNAVNAAEAQGLTPTSVAPSRPACANCQQTLAERGIPIQNP